MSVRIALLAAVSISYVGLLMRWFHDPGIADGGFRELTVWPLAVACVVLVAALAGSCRARLRTMAAELGAAWRLRRSQVVLLLVLIALSLAVQLPTVLYPAGLVHSDAAINGLMALHISEGRAAPGFYYGQMFMGTSFSHVLAAVFYVTGPFVGGLALLTGMFYAGFLVATYFAVRGASEPVVAAAVTFWLAIPPAPLLATLAQSEYPQLLLFGAWAMAVAGARGSGALRDDAWWCVSGALLGLAFWSHPVAAIAAVAVAGCVVIVVPWRRVAGVGARLAAGFVAGILPGVVAWGSSLGRFIEWFLAGGYRDGGATMFEAATGMVRLSFGVLLLGSPEHAPLPWGAALPLAALVVGSAAWIGWQAAAARWGAAVSRAGAPGRRDPGAPVISPVAVLPPALFVLIYVAVLVGRHGYPETPVHYVVPIYLGVPAVVAAALHVVARRHVPRRAGPLVAVVVAASALFSLPGSIGFLRALPANQASMDESLRILRAEGIDSCLGPYWDAYRISYLTLEEIVCESVDVKRVPGYPGIVAERSGGRPPAFVAAPQRQAAVRARRALLESRGVAATRSDTPRFLVLIPQR